MFSSIKTFFKNILRVKPNNISIYIIYIHTYIYIEYFTRITN